jgi:ADP-ribosylglycohydrolase
MSLGNNEKQSDVDLVFAWISTTSGQRRSSSIEGMFWGTMIGEALASGRAKHNRQTQLAVYGRPPLRFSLILGRGYPDHHFHFCLISSQAVLRSRSNSEAFLNEFLRRRNWYYFSQPIRLLSSLIARNKTRWDRQTELMSIGIQLASILQGSGASASRWLQLIAEKTNSQSALPAAQILAKAAQIAILDQRVTSHRIAVWAELESLARDENLSEMMRIMEPMLSQGRSVRMATLLMGWGEKMPADPNAIACLAIYAWLRHSHRFRFAVERSISSTGATTTVGVLSGALAGISLGLSKIPTEWVGGIQIAPYDREFLSKLNRRLTDWPHGVDDLHRAPAFPVYPIRQLVRNAGLCISKLVNTILRAPYVIASDLRVTKKGKKRHCG